MGGVELVKGRLHGSVEISSHEDVSMSVCVGCDDRLDGSSVGGLIGSRGGVN